MRKVRWTPTSPTRHAIVSVVEPADLRRRDDTRGRQRRDGTRDRRILAEREILRAIEASWLRVALRGGERVRDCSVLHRIFGCGGVQPAVLAAVDRGGIRPERLPTDGT